MYFVNLMHIEKTKKKTAYVSELQNRSSYEKVENLNWKTVSVCCHSGIL